jgi:chemotaxis signal transduction protein
VTGFFVRVGTQGEHYAFAVESIVEVTKLGVVTALYDTHPCLLGVTNLRGEILPVFDFAAVLHGERLERPRRLLVVASGELRAGLVVEEVDTIASLGTALEPTSSELVPWGVLVEGALVGVVDVDELCARLAPR